MQENEFEKRIREKMDELKLVPNEEVWKRVSANIGKEKRRKRLFAFLLPFTLLIGVGGIYFYINHYKVQPSLAVENNAKESANTSGKKTINLLERKDYSQRKTYSPKAINSTSPLVVRDIQKKEQEQNNSDHPVAVGKPDDKTKKAVSSSIETNFEEVDRNESTDVVRKQENTNVVRKQADGALSHTGYHNAQKADSSRLESIQHQPLAKTDVAAENVADKKIPEVKKDFSAIALAESKSAQKIKIPASKKWNFGFTAFGGVSNNFSGFKIFPVAANYSNAVPAPSSSASNGFAATRLNYKSGFSYAFGIYVKKMVGKKTGFSAGVNYHLVSATSNVGTRNSTATTFFDANLQNRLTVNEYYYNGQSSKYRNKYHVVEMPLNLLLQLNKNKGLAFSAGITAGYLIASNALYVNSSQNVYYAAKDQFKKLQFSAQTGIQATALNLPHFNITAGPEVQYGLNNMAKAVTSTNQHLFSAGVKVNVTLK